MSGLPGTPDDALLGRIAPFDGDLVTLCDLAGRIVEVNDRSAECMGLPRAQLIGRPFYAVRSDEERAVGEAQLALILRDGRLHYQTVFQRPDGSRCPIEVSARLLGEGEHARILLLGRDLSERRSLQDSLSTLNRWYLCLGELSDAAVRIRDTAALLRTACRLVADNAGFRRVWIASPTTGGDGVVTVADSAAGEDAGAPQGSAAAACALRAGGEVICNGRRSSLPDCGAGRREACVADGSVAALVIPRMAGERQCLVLSADQPDYFRGDILPLMRRVAGLLGHALDALLATQALQHEADRLDKIGRHVPGMIYQFRQFPDGHACFPWASVGIEQIYGVQPEAVRLDAGPVLARIHPDDLPRVQASIQASADTQSTWRCEYRVRLPQRGERWLYGESEPERLDDGSTLWHGHIIDITLRREDEAALRLAAGVFAHSREAIMVIGPDGRVQAVNPEFARITGYAATDIIGHPPDLLAADAQSAALLAEVREALATNGDWQGELWSRRRSGEVFPLWLSINRVFAEHDAVLHDIGVFTDISDRKQAEEKVAYLALHDSLTGLPNRRLLTDRLRHALATAGREGRRLAVLFLDLDHFKLVNDTLGHAVGDQLLQAAARRLQEHVREGDTVCRQGGDEFLVVAEDVADTGAVEQLAERLLLAMRQPFQIGPHLLDLSTSIGIAVFPHDGDDAESLVQKADTALYQAKESGRDTFRFFADDMNVKAVRRLALLGRLRRALERSELQLHYQPEVCLGSGRVLGFEALLRWTDAELGTVSPAEFVPVAEDSGLIVPIGEWALDTACREVQRWRAAGFGGFVAVNLSALQFRRRDFCARVKDVLERIGLPGSALELELTESILLQGEDNAVDTLRRLRALGVRCSIDDFGTGYSSLAYLRRLPIDKLKIDRSFVADAEHRHDGRSILNAMLQIGNGLGLPVVAEGIENASQLRMLCAMGCTQGQGFHFARALPADRIADFLARGALDVGAD